jgi:hypothetical protein
VASSSPSGESIPKKTTPRLPHAHDLIPRNLLVPLPQRVIAATGRVRCPLGPKRPQARQGNRRIYNRPDDSRLLPLRFSPYRWRLRHPSHLREEWADVPILPFAACCYPVRGDGDPRRPAVGLVIDPCSSSGTGTSVEGDGVRLGRLVVRVVHASLAGRDKRCRG